MSDICNLFPYAFQHPDKVGQSEYRAIHECIEGGLEELPVAMKRDHAIAMLDEFIDQAKAIKKSLKTARRASANTKKES